MGDIASLNINGVTYGLKDEVARSGGGGGSILGYGQFGQFVYNKYTFPLRNSSEFSSIFNYEGQGYIHAVAVGAMLNNINSGRANCKFCVIVDGQELINYNRYNVAVNSTTKNVLSGVSLTSGFYIDQSNNWFANFGWSIKRSVNYIHFTYPYNYGTSLNIEYSNLPVVSKTAESIDVIYNSMISPIIFRNNIDITYSISYNKTDVSGSAGAAIICTTFQP